jgi:glyoxylase-like metal-dependent hydrolase (beta-lactamase superfamily II)
MPYSVKIMTYGSLEENCYFLRDQGRSDGILVDPGSSGDEVAKELDALKVRPLLMVATHGHFDHIGAVHDLAERFHCPFAMSRHDEGLLEALEDTFALYGLGKTRRPKVDLWLQPGVTLDYAGLSLKVLPTPGHTPGGLCYWHPESLSLFSGDTLFEGSVGRSDFEGSSHEQLIAGIRKELLALPDGAVVYPGHGGTTTIGAERRQNRFLQ